MQDAAGYSIYSELLVYDHKHKLATTEKDVRIESRGLSVEGTGMIFNVAEKTLQLSSDVKGVFQPR
jgi:LPS export ABC transporter protein LptC